MNPSQAIGPLSVGNVVSAGFRLYNDNRQRYLLVSLRAIAWTGLGLLYALLIVGLVIGGSFAAIAVGAGGDRSPGFLAIGLGVLLILPGIPLWIFCAAKRIYNATLIARNAYMYLANRPEPMRQTDQSVRRKIWPFWLTRVLVALILYIPNLATSFLQQIFGIGFNSDNRVIMIISGILVFAVVLIGWGVQAWLAARLLIPEVALAVEEELKTANSISRSWMLTNGNSLRIILILLVALLVTLPLYSLAVLPAILIAALLIPSSAWQSLTSASPITTNAAQSAVTVLIVFGLAFAVYLILLQVIELLVIPFWQSIKAVVYYDLRNRREGLGLRLSDRP
jgi:hypothetical protein